MSQIPNCTLTMASCASHPIILQHSLIIYISRKCQLISWSFCMEIEGRRELRLSLLIGCGQVYLTSKQIKGFLIINITGRNQRYLRFFAWRYFLQGKVASETSTYGWVWQVVSLPIRLQDSLISNISGNNQLIFLIFCMEMISKGRQHLRLPIFIECGQVCLWSNQIPGFLDHQYL